MTNTFAPFRALRNERGSVTRSIFALVAICGAVVTNSAAQSSKPSETNVTFAQLTDAHIFDDGWNQPVSAAFRLGASDREALEWSVQEINRLIQKGVKIEFVVYTGDLGLQNVDFPREGSCTANPASPERGLPPFNLTSALNEIAEELNLLAVRQVYFVPGNNDLMGEAVTDNQRYQCFVSLLKTKLQSLSPPMELKGLDLENSFESEGIRFAALNSASFKDLKNYNGPCVAAAGTSALLLKTACPQSQLKSLKKLVGTTTPLILFTHVPYLKDPYRKIASWNLPDELRRTWEEDACQANLIAIFAGHFHDANRAYYGSTSGSQLLEISHCVAQKTLVAPPLAIKNQQDKPTRARGFLLATVSSGGAVRADVHWFEEQKSNLAPGPQGWWERWPMTVVLVVVFLAGICLLALPLGSVPRATGAALVWLPISFAVLWTAKTQFAITESAIIVTLLLLPFVIFGVFSGYLTEFTVPGGGGAKFRQVSAETVDPSQAGIDEAAVQMQMIPKVSLQELLGNVQRIIPGKPVVLTMTVGKGTNYYQPVAVQQALDRLLKIPEFTFVVFVDGSSRLVTYIPGWLLRQSFDAPPPSNGYDLVQAVNDNREQSVRQFLGMITRTVSTKTTNAQALKEMNEAGLDAIMAVEQDTHKPVGVVVRDRILTSMMLALAKGAKA